MPTFKKDRSKFKMKHTKDTFPFKSTEPSPNKFLGKLARGIGKAAKTVARNTPIGLGIRAARGEFSKKNRGGGGGAAAGRAQGIVGRGMGGMRPGASRGAKMAARRAKTMRGRMPGRNLPFGMGGGGRGPGGMSGGGFPGAFMSDVRVKENINKIGVSPSGIPIYEFNYIGDNNKYSGAMAQDLLKINPSVVVLDKESGYYKVNYNNIDVDMRLLN